MNGILIATTVIGVLYKFASGFTVVPQLNSQEKTYPDDGSYKSINNILQSIENRIKNLESTMNMQYTTLAEGKMEYYGRKIEKIEKGMTQFEAYVRIEMDKLLENISNKNFKEEITKDHTIRKIDSVYERISHKLNSIEGQIDVTNIKYQNARETVLSKLDKMEENQSIRDSDLEAEIANAVAAVDDLKTTCTNMEDSLINLTRDSLKVLVKNGEKSSKKLFNQAINTFEDVTKNISADIMQLHKTIDKTMNQSLETYSKLDKAKIDLDESMNEYANKIMDMYSDLSRKTDIIDKTITHLAVITNITRNEQQNGLRALTVEVGRQTTKNGLSDSIMDNEKLSELIKKVESNFENVMSAQNLFLESCHRVQMDESQLELQISIVLNKLIDTFENKTTVGPKDIKHLEHLIHNHDSNIRKSIYHITSHLLNLIQKNSDNKDEIVDYIKSQLLHLDALHMMIQDSLSTKSSEQDNDILHELQVLHGIINAVQTSLEKTNKMNYYMNKMFNSSEPRKLTSTTKLDEVLENMKNISIIINSIEEKINRTHFNIFFSTYNTKIATNQLGKHLKEYIQLITENDNQNTTQHKNLINMFVETSDIKLHESPMKPITILAKMNDVENIVVVCNNKADNSSCNKIHIPQYELIKQSNTGDAKGKDQNILTIEETRQIKNCKNYTELNDKNDSLTNCTEHNLALNVTNLINNNAPVTQKLSNISKNYYDYGNIKTNHSSNYIFKNTKIDKNQEETIFNNNSDSRMSDEINYMNNYGTIMDTKSTSVLHKSSSYNNTGYNSSTELNENANYSNIVVIEEEISTSLKDIKPVFQTTESTVYLQIEDTFSSAIIPSTTTEESPSVKNQLSTVFENDINPD